MEITQEFAYTKKKNLYWRWYIFYYKYFKKKFLYIFLYKNFFVIINSVIIFLKSKVKNSQRWYFAWENLRGGFCDVGCHLLICRCSSFFCCSSRCFLTLSLTLPWTIARVFTPHFILSAQPIAGVPMGNKCPLITCG